MQSFIKCVCSLKCKHKTKRKENNAKIFFKHQWCTCLELLGALTWNAFNEACKFAWQCRHFRQFCLVMVGKIKTRTVSLAPPNAPWGQNEKKKKPSLPSLPYAISKHPFGFKCCLTRTSYFFWDENFSGHVFTCHLQAWCNVVLKLLKVEIVPFT